MKKINISVFVLILFALGLMNIFHTTDALVLEGENRHIEKPELSLHTLMAGDYFRAVDGYFADTFIMRDNFIEISSKFDTIKGITFEDEVEIFTTSAINVANRIAEQPALEIENNTQLSYDADEMDDSELMKDFENRLKQQKIDRVPKEETLAVTSLGRILIVDNQAMEMHTYNEEAVKGYAEAVNYIAERVDAKVYSLLVPTLIEFVEKKKYRDISYSQKETIHEINDLFSDKVEPIDVYSNLKNHMNEYIYMATDHHWTALGAFRAYEAFCDQLDIDSIPLDSFERNDFEGYLGSLYRVSQSKKLEENPDTIYAYLPVVETSYRIKKNSEWTSGKVINLNYFNKERPSYAYGVYLQGDSAISIITSEVDNDRSILVIKDSYANSFIPFLTSHYKSVHIIDPRMFTGNVIDYINDEALDEVLFFNYVLVNRYMGYVDLFNCISGNH